MSNGLAQRVIFNADDFGRSRSVNEAVIRAHREGVLTTASLMVNGEAFDEAVQLARQHPSLGVGLHLTLVKGKATLPPGQIPGLVNARGEFTGNAVAAGLNAFFKRSLRAQLEAEIRAQMVKFQATGLVMDHLNGHLNFHLHPSIFGILIRLFDGWRANHEMVGADVRRLSSIETTEGSHSLLTSAPTRDTGETRLLSPRATRLGDRNVAPPPMRLTRDPFWLNAKLAGGRWLYRASHAIIFSLLSARTRPTLNRLGISHTDAVFGLLQNARVNEEYLLKLLPRLPAGDVEIYSHPCLNDFPDEFASLTSPFVKGLTKKLGIQLCRYQDL